MILRAALDHLCAGAVAGKAAQMASYHKAPREYLGTANPHIDTCVRAWRPALDVAGQVALARELWRTDIHEARIAAAKLLTRRRIEGDGQVWDEIQSWAPDFDAWAIADHAAAAGAARLWAVPARLDDLDAWTRDGSFWVRRAALVFTLPWAKPAKPTAAENAGRERVLAWAAGYTTDPEWFIQKAVAWWLRDLSKRDGLRVRAFLGSYGAGMKPFARREAAKYLG